MVLGLALVHTPHACSRGMILKSVSSAKAEWRATVGSVEQFVTLCWDCGQLIGTKQDPVALSDNWKARGT